MSEFDPRLRPSFSIFSEERGNISLPLTSCLPRSLSVILSSLMHSGIVLLSLSLSSAFISLFIFNSVHKELGSTIQSGLIKFKGVFPIFVNGRNRESIFQDPEWGLVNMLQDYNSLMDNPLHLSLETKSLTHYKIL